MNRGNEFVVVSGGHKITDPSFGQDLTHDEAIQRIKDLMYTNANLQEALNQNSELLRVFVPRINEMEAQQKQKDDMIEVYRQQAKQLITNLRTELLEKKAVISKLEPQIQDSSSSSQQIHEYQAALKAEKEHKSALVSDIHRQQQQIENLRQEKAALLEDNKLLRQQTWTVVDREEKQAAVLDNEGSSNIPVMVDQHRVTVDTLPSDQTETIYDDVAAPDDADNERREMQLKIDTLRGQVVELEAKLREKDMELRDVRQGDGRSGVAAAAAAAACEARGQAEENLQRERAGYREREQQMVAQISAYQAQLRNMGDSSEVATLRQQVQQIVQKTNATEQQLAHKQAELSAMQNRLAATEQQLQETAAHQQAVHQELEMTKKEKTALKEQYDQLVTDHHNLLQQAGSLPPAAPAASPAEESDRLTANVLALEEGLERKEAELRKLKQQVEEVEVLKAQAEIYKADFDAERQAREVMNSEKIRLEEELRAAQFRNQELQDEIQQISQTQIAELQRRHAMGRPGAHIFPGPRPSYHNAQPPPDAHTAASRHVPASRATAEQFHSCPICQRNFPDQDSLQVHCMDCDGN